MIGKTLAHYKIVEKIGEGGMGEVFRARDTRLGRDVALKVLPPEAARDPERRRRFETEAKAVAALQHSNIVTIHSIEQVDGLHFLTMELVNGRMLSDVVPANGLARGPFMDIAIPLVDAVAFAHAKGITHRDLKPDNIMLDSFGRVKILDFGLAKLLAGPDDGTTLCSDPHTRMGQVVGTPAYMSPEQALGHEVTFSTDIFSLGVVLYEMATGRRAFSGSTPAAVFDAILNRAPAAPSGLNPGLPTELDDVIGRAIEKDPDLRYPGAADLLAELERLREDAGSSRPKATAEPETRRAVAVRPFTVHSGDEEYHFLSLALAEAVSHALSSNQGLVVRPTSAVARFSTRQVDPLEVARELNAEVVVEGSIQTLGRAVRIQVQAWDAPAGSTRLSVKLDGNLDDLFGLQDRVAEKLEAGLGIRQEEPPSRLSTPEPRAYEQFLRASERLLRWSHADTVRAVEMLRSTVALDPRFSDAWARLSAALVTLGSMFDPDPNWFDEAEAAIEKALALDPANPEAWSAKGRLLWTLERGFQHAESLRNLGRACMHPSCPPEAPLWKGLVLSHCGLHEEAISMLDEALEADPNDLLALLTKGETLGWMGHLEAFEDHVERVISRDPVFPYGHLFRPTTLIYLDKLEKGEDAIRAARRIVGDDTMLQASEGLLWAKRGERDKAHSALKSTMQRQRSVSHSHHTYHYVAAAYATLGEGVKAVEELDRAARTGLPNHAAFSNDPHFDPLRERDDFKATMTRLRGNSELLRGVLAETSS